MNQKPNVEMGASFITENEKRQTYLDWLYAMSGRNNTDNEFYGLYTGLIQERKDQLLRQEMESMTKLLNLK